MRIFGATRVLGQTCQHAGRREDELYEGEQHRTFDEFADRLEHQGLLHHVDDDKQAAEKRKQATIVGLVKTIRRRLLAAQHDGSEGEIAEAKLANIGCDGCRGHL